MKYGYSFMAALILLSGCAAIPKVSSEDELAANTPLYCSAPTECEKFWRRAQVWLAENSRFRLQLVSDAVISTYGPVSGDMQLAYQVTRSPDGDGRDRIKIWAGCGNMFGCTVHPFTATARLKKVLLDSR